MCIFIYGLKIFARLRTTFILIILAAGSAISAQTDSIEKAALYNKMITREITDAEFKKSWNAWTNFLKKSEYPDLPLDNKGNVHYTEVTDFRGLDRETLFTRILEFLSVSYGLIPSDIYSDPKSGKIIFRNSMDLVTGNACIYTSVISIKDGRIRTELFNIIYQTYFEGEYSYDTWVPERTINTPINEILPIVLKKPSEWPQNLNLLRITSELFDAEVKNLSGYIMDYNDEF